jgi:hypothetical protein
MLADVVPLIDRIMGVLKDRKALAAMRFTEHVEPLFLDMCLVHNDYRETFRELLDQVSVE